MSELLELYGDPLILSVGGLFIGGLFGFFAQRSRFCLRAAVVEFWHRKFGEKLSVWLLAFSSAVILVQIMVLSGFLDKGSARQISATGSLSGALVGGILFGLGMILTRGCASRLLVLSANGNLRALLSGLIFAVTAQASLAGVLLPVRTEISSWWVIEGGPSAEWLMRVLSYPSPEIGFEFGMLPGVFLGSLIGALLGRDFKLEGFNDGYSMRRHIVGAILMGFGSMLAGGCAVGAGVTGGAIFALTAWVSLLGMWIGAGLTDRLIDTAPVTPSFRAP
ncbi:MAG: YeeE/YedE family protein [Burkholderiaceae bacterium]